MQKHRENDPAKRSRPQHDNTGRSRQQPGAHSGMLSVRLTRKYANMIDGVNLTDAHVGDRLGLPQHDAEMLIAEGWAEHSPRRSTHKPERAHAADRSTDSPSPRAETRGDKPRRKKSSRGS